MPEFLIIDPAALAGVTLARQEGADAKEAVKLTPAHIDLPPRVVVVPASNFEHLLVVEPGESATSVVTRTRTPEAPQEVTASSATPDHSEAAVTWAPVPAAEAYRVYKNDAKVAEVAAERFQAPVEGDAAEFSVSAVAGGSEGPKSKPARFEKPTA